MEDDNINNEENWISHNNEFQEKNGISYIFQKL